MDTFGALLRKHRKRGRILGSEAQVTQLAFLELLGDKLGYILDPTVISRWENNKRTINADDRHILISLIQVLSEVGGIVSLSEANDLLKSGRYEQLSVHEIQVLNEKWMPSSLNPRRNQKLTDDNIDDFFLVITSRDDGREYEVDLKDLYQLFSLSAKPPNIELPEEKEESINEARLKFETLSRREHELFEVVATDGYYMTNKELGKALGISYATVRKHLRNIYQKLNIKSSKASILHFKNGPLSKH